MKPEADQRSPSAIAYQWASRIITISIEMVAPGLAGYWLDQRIGLTPAFTIVGFGAGLVFGMWHLIRMARPRNVSGDLPRDLKQ